MLSQLHMPPNLVAKILIWMTGELPLCSYPKIMERHSFCVLSVVIFARPYTSMCNMFSLVTTMSLEAPRCL